MLNRRMYGVIPKVMPFFQFYPAKDDDFIQIVDSTKKIALIFDEDSDLQIGEMNAANELDGRGIVINRYGDIRIEYYKDGFSAAGRYITIYSYGSFEVGQLYANANGALKNRGTYYIRNRRTFIGTDFLTHYSFQNLAQHSAGFLGIGTRQEYLHLKVVASLKMYFPRRIVYYWGEAKEYNGVWLPHGRGVMRDNRAKTVTFGWWYEGHLAVAGQSANNPEGNYIKIWTEETFPEIPDHILDG